MIAASAVFITAAVIAFASLKRPREKVRLGGVLWIFAGAVTAIAVSIGLVDMAVNGYGDGTIF